MDFKGDSMGRLLTVRELTNMFACINGIICIAGIFRGHYGFVLWNPAIRKGKVVSYPNFPDCPAHFVLTGSYYAFGFDQNSNDYKVVRVEEHRKKSAENSITRYRNSFYVYSLRADSWTQILGTLFSITTLSCILVVMKYSLMEFIIGSVPSTANSGIVMIIT